MPKPVLVVERVAHIRGRAVLDRARLPPAVGGVVLAGGGSKDELDVAPGEGGVGRSHEGGHARDDGRGGGSAAEAGPVAVGLVGRGDRRQSGSAAVGWGADPDVGARLGVVTPDIVVADRAGGGDRIEVRNVVEVGVVVAFVPMPADHT